MSGADSTKVLEAFWSEMSTHLRAKLEMDELLPHLQARQVLRHYESLHAKEPESPPPDEEALRKWVSDRHGFWLLWHDEARNEFHFPTGLVTPDQPIVFGRLSSDKKPPEPFKPRNEAGQWERYKELVVKKGYPLASGSGSVGLGVRLDKGVCLRDTIRDTRGAVAFEDLLSSNYSFIGIPLYRCSPDTEQHNDDGIAETRLGLKGTPFVYFCLLYPARGAWHSEDKGCHSGNEDGLTDYCLYRRLSRFCKRSVMPVVKVAYEMLQLRAAQVKMAHIAKLGNKAKQGDAFRNDVLSTFIELQGDKTHRDLLGFHTATLHEVYDSPSGDWKCALKATNLQDLYQSTLQDMCVTNPLFKQVTDGVLGGRRTDIPLPDLEAQLTVLTGGGEPPAKDISSIIEILRVRHAALVGAHPAWREARVEPVDALSAALEQLKWRELVTQKTCQALVHSCVGSSAPDDDLVLLEKMIKQRQPTPSASDPIVLADGVLLAVVRARLEWAIDDIRTTDSESQERATYELTQFYHTKATIFRLLGALRDASMLPSISDTLTVATPSSEVLKSEVGPPSETSILDYGACTAVNDSLIWAAWGFPTAPPDSIDITGITENAWRIIIGSLQFTVSRNAESSWWQYVAHALSETARKQLELKGRIRLEKLPARHFQDAEAALHKLFSTHRCGTQNGKLHCLPCISIVATKRPVHPAQPYTHSDAKPACSPCPFTQGDGPKLLNSIVTQGHSDAIAVNVNSYLFSPLWISNSQNPNGALRGFLVLGAPQREYDTARRIHYSEHQLTAVQFASDYLELAMSRELVTEEAQNERARAEAVAHLVGIEPEVQGLIQDVKRMKWAAERVASKIAPSQHGVFALDADTVKLFRPQRVLTVDFDVLAADSERDRVWAQVVGQSEAPAPAKSELRAADFLQYQGTWQSGLSLHVREGQWGRDTSWLFRSAHDNDSVGVSEWEQYRRMLYLLGTARANTLMQAFGKYVPHNVDECRRLFNAVKLLFHRLHHPDETTTDKHVYTVQLLAAVANMRRVTVSRSPSSWEYCFYSSFIEAIAKRDDIVVLSKADDSPKWRIGDRAACCIAALHGFCQEFCHKDRAVRLQSIDVGGTDALCTISLNCSGSFDKILLQRPTVAPGEVAIASEHGLTGTVLDLERCVRAYLKKGSSEAFAYTVEYSSAGDATSVVTIKFDAPSV